MANYIARDEGASLTGSNFSGSDGATNRTLALSYTGALQALSKVTVQGVTLTPNAEYTIASDALTLLVPLNNFMIVSVDYLQAVSGSATIVTEYTTAALVEAEVRATTPFSPSTTPTLSQVEVWIAEETAFVDRLLGESFSQNTASSVLVDYDGSGILTLPHSPVISITSIQYNVNSHLVSPSWITLESGFGKNYLEYLDEGEIEFINGGEGTYHVSPIGGKKKFRLTYSYGYASVPLDIQKLTTLLVSKRVIQTLISSQANSEGGEIRVGTIMVADPTSFSNNYLVNLNKDIDDTLSKMRRDFKVFRLNRVYD